MKVVPRWHPIFSTKGICSSRLRTVWPSLSYGTYYTALSGIMLVIVLLMN